ncbi:helix-turn-helix transcriptional regulator [Phenylobacterium sp. SCN 70-31]|uniref:helix-turn-helix domain-containing protein n=1 Tax=Phenylobacterium sp. SCN 70-31 TaxID=1660129 RepID=UPI00086DAB73|nr:helix-turn-helix transcriptional regulator [Phenylobacterium sp. SCN 70-31]ODT85948.1 MAG: transcriptional regulator [Phenylobacterium sp. SCN 70-31]
MPKTIFGGDHQHLVEVLIETRKSAGLTQVELSQRIGRDQTFISLIERGQRRVDVIEFIGMAKAMGMSPTDLFAEVVSRTSVARS